MKDAEVAKRQAQKQREKQARDALKATKFPKTNNRKPPQSELPRKKHNHRGVGGSSQPLLRKRSTTPPPKVNGRGRKIAPLESFQKHSLSYRYIHYSTKQPHDNDYCTWLDNPILVIPQKVIGVRITRPCAVMFVIKHGIYNEVRFQVRVA